MQAVASAPLWDEDQGMVIGMISASDFIHVLRRLRHRCSLLSPALPRSERLFPVNNITQPSSCVYRSIVAEHAMSAAVSQAAAIR